MKRLRKDRGGFTLVEIMSTFALTAIFMSSAALVLTTFMKSHTVASAVATEQNVASIVMETVTSNLGSARYEKKIFSGTFHAAEGTLPELSGTETDKDEYTLLISSDESGNSEVWYVDGETENVVKMYVKKKEEDGKQKNYLALDYYVKPEVGETTEWECVPWQLGEGVYQNCSIKSFTVDRLAADRENSCLSVTLELTNGIAGEDNSFTLSRTFDCYNLAAKNIVKL